MISGLVVIAVGAVGVWWSFRGNPPPAPTPAPAVVEAPTPLPAPTAAPQPTPEATPDPAPVEEADPETTQAAATEETDATSGILELVLRPAAMVTVDGFHVPDGGQRASESHRFTGLTPGEHNFKVFRDGYTTQEDTVSIAAGRTSNLVVRLEPAL